MHIRFCFFILSILTISLVGCKHSDKNHTHEHSEHNSEHTTESDEEHEEEGEEDGTMLSITDSYDVVKKGVRLVLAFNVESEHFEGTAINTTEEPIENVRVEVHLSNGVELGPTERTTLKPGERVAVQLDATGQVFERWNTHAETGNEEHNHEGEGEHSHGDDENHEHE